MLRVYNNISISASKKASDLPFHTCHFQILRNWPKHSSNPTYSDWLQDQGHIDTIDRKKKKTFIPPDTARKICYISLKKVCRSCYRAYYQIASGIKMDFFLSHKGHGSIFLHVHCLFMFFSPQKPCRFIYLFMQNLKMVNRN